METCFNYCEKDKAFFSSDEKKWINRIRRLAKKYPDKVFILKQPEDNDGCIYARLPPSALQIRIQECTLSPEQIEAAGKRLKEARQKQEKNGL